MRKYLLTAIVAMIFTMFATTVSAQDTTYTPRIIPAPMQCDLSAINYVPFRKVTIATDAAEANKWAKDHFALWYKKLAPSVNVVAYNGSDDLHKEAYSISINNNGVKISAKNIEGVRHALHSLRQIVMPGRGTQKVESYIVPTGAINDYPSMDFRGLHICWFPETQEWEIERMIRLAGYYKINYIVLEQWGTYQSKVAPWLCWPDTPMTKKAIKRMVAISKDLGITLIPQLNIFGHASFSRSKTGKHATLDIRPEYQPLFEPLAGWNWCLSNPETNKLIKALIVELLEDFDNPPFFHIGCDEAHTPSCPECSKKPYSQIFVDHIVSIHKMLAERGVRAMMWQDMLLKKGDPRWKGYKANGTDETAKAAEYLPKDIIICDWFYREPLPEFKSYSYFKELGYDHLACPWDRISAITAESKAAKENGSWGVLGTLWNHYSGYSLALIYCNVAGKTWNTEARTAKYGSYSAFKTHLREVCWDMKLKDYRQFGLNHYQIPYDNMPNPLL